MAARADQAMAAIERLGPAYVKASVGRAGCEIQPAAARVLDSPAATPPWQPFDEVAAKLLLRRDRCLPRRCLPRRWPRR